MAAPPNKASLLGQLEGYSAKPADKPLPKQRDKSRSSKPTPLAVPTAPTAKTRNPDLGAQVSTGPEAPPLQAAPIAPPVPALQKFGVNMDINQVNDHVERIANAYSATAGYTPGAGIVFDLLKANNLLTQDGKVDVNYEDLFGVAHSKRDAMAKQIARAGDSDPIATAPVIYLTPKEIVKGITEALHEDAKHASWASAGEQPYFHAWMKENSDSIEDAWTHPESRKALIQGLNPVTSFRPAAYLREGLVADPRDAGFVLHGIGQIVESTADMPYGAYMLGRAVTLDTYDSLMLLRNQVRGRTGLSTEKVHAPNHSLGMLKQMARQVLDDVAHPKQNAGYLTMDIWAAFTVGAGTVNRVSRFARAEGVAAKGRALITKAPPESTLYTWNNPDTGMAAYQATVPLNDTIATQVIQKHFPVVGRTDRAARLEAEMTHGYDSVTPRALINDLLPTSKSIARQMHRDEKMEMAIALTPVTEMVRLLKAQSWGAGIRDVVEGNRRFSLSRLKGAASRQSMAIDAMLRIYFLDDPDPYNAWRGVSERMIQQADALRGTLREDFTNAAMKANEDLLPDEAGPAVDSNPHYNRADRQLLATIDAHKAQLEALELGRRLWETTPTKEIKQIREYAEEVAGLREKWLYEYSGFSYEQMEQHIAELGAAVRGENVIYTGNELRPWEKGISAYSENETRAVQLNLEKHTKALKDAEKRLSKAQATHRLRPGVNSQELEHATNAVERHGKRLASTQKRMQKIQEGTTPLVKAIGPDGRVTDEFLQYHAERLASELNTHIEWNKRTREKNEVYATGDPKSRALSRVAPIHETSHPPLKENSNLRRDTEHNRDNTNNYMGVLHELGHRAYKLAREGKLQRGAEHFTFDSDWRRRVMERVQQDAEDFGRRHGQHEPLPGGELYPQRAATTMLKKELKIEEEAGSWNWAIRNAAEPMRHQVLLQAEKWFDSYYTNFVRNYLRQPIAGPEFDKLHATFYDESLIGPDGENIPRQGDLIAERRKGTAGSLHIPMHSEKYRDQGGRRIRRFRSRFGVTPLDSPIKSWSGESLKLGNFRMDTSALMAEQLHTAHRAYMHYVRHNDLWDAATVRPMTGNEVPIRDISTIPDELRDFVTQMERTKLEPNFDSVINDAMLDNLRKVLYPTKEEVLDGTIPAAHVRYVDENLILDKIGGVPTEFWNAIDRFMSNTMGVINEPMRLMLIFGTPAYALNWLGSAALGMIHDGPMAPIHYGEALMSNKAYGGEVTRIFDRIAGQTHASALVSEKNFFTKGSQALQNGWGNLTDLHWRRAMVIKELKRHGLLEGSNEEIKAALLDPKNSKKISQAGDTARKAMLDFNSLTMPERAVLRHMFFVYSFVRASGLWSLRFLRDHGVQSDAYAQSGKGRQENIDQMIGKMPDWFMRGGYFAIHPNLVYNPIQWNMPGMLEQIATPLYSIFGHTPYSSAAELLGPAPTLLTEAMTGYDTQGQQLPGPGGNLEKAILAQYNQTFLGQIATKHKKAEKEAAHPLKPEAVESTFLNPISSAMARERSGLNQSVFDVDGFNNTWGLAIMRSALPRGTNRVAGEARYWRDLRDNDPAAYHQHELDKVTEMVKRQAEVVGEPVPGSVINAVDMVSRVSQAIDDYKREHKGEPTPNTKTITQITIQSLLSQGRITDGKGWLNRLKKADTEAEVKEIRIKALYAGGAEAWKNWVDRVKAIDSYANANYNVYVDGVKKAGLGDYTASTSRPQKDRWAYGRQAEKLIAKSKQLASEVGAKTGNAAKESRQEWIDYVNQHDKPISVAGVEYPSPFAYEFATKTDTQQRKAMASWSKRKPGELTAMQTELLTGSRPDPIVTKAWETLYHWLQDAKKQAGVGHPIVSGTYATYYNHLMNADPDVKKAFSFALLPLGKRMTTYKPVKNSQFASDWNWMLGLVNGRYDQLSKSYVNADTGKPRQSVISDQWKTNDVPALQELVTKRNPGFLSELRIYTGATNDGNADEYLTKFLGKLIAP